MENLPRRSDTLVPRGRAEFRQFHGDGRQPWQIFHDGENGADQGATIAKIAAPIWRASSRFRWGRSMAGPVPERIGNQNQASVRVPRIPGVFHGLIVVSLLAGADIHAIEIKGSVDLRIGATDALDFDGMNIRASEK